MPCAEIDNAFSWSKQNTLEEHFPVVAYFTKHFGLSGGANAKIKDLVHYASGEVTASATVLLTGPFLFGTLKVSKNTDLDGQMIEDSHITYDVEIFSNEKLSYLMKINGVAVGGLPPTKVQATCVNDVLLTATSGSEVVTIGVARKPNFSTPVPS
jgi:hypothetical protein